MKKFIIAASIVVLLLFAWNTAYYQFGIYIDLNPEKPVTTFMKVEGKEIYMERNGVYEPFEIRGVNMGVGIPGEWATDYAIDKETYLRWFKWIQEMGVNTVRVYTILHTDFYEAFYEYNTEREENGEEPLWLIHGVWVNDYIQNSHRSAYDEEFIEPILEDSRILVDILHGNRNFNLGYGAGSGSYRHDVSKWVLGYIVGVEWEDVTVTYTNHKYPDRNVFKGKYMYTSPDASPFEAVLCMLGDKLIEYETGRYKQQRLVAFSNWPTTDPFDYPDDITRYFMKCAKVDVEHIKTTDQFLAGQFVSYHIYPYYPDYLNYIYRDREEDDFDVEGSSVHNISDIINITNPIENYMDGGLKANCLDKRGQVNTYYTYLKAVADYHSMPVIISEYGVSTGRGMAQKDYNTGRNQGNMSEQEQGYAIIECYEDIIDSGCKGSCVFTWQDEWFKRTWNTMQSVDLDNTPYWSDYQTNEQYFGLLSFDPGWEESVCYVDGDVSEWSEDDVVVNDEDISLSMKYDEKFIYFLVKKDNFSEANDMIYIPLDITPKTGSTYCANYDISFERASDFVMVIDGKDNSRILVQERYENLRAMFYHETHDRDAYLDAPGKEIPVFKKIDLMLQTAMPLLTGNWRASAETYETGLLTYGNANPKSDDFNSLADFIFNGDYVEIKVPWQIFNFSNPSEMMVHDDYYECYGVENMHIDEIFVGIADSMLEKKRIPMESFPLEPWYKDVTYHERLKESYYILKDYWNRQ